MISTWNRPPLATENGKVPCARCKCTPVWPSRHAPGTVSTLCDGCATQVNSGSEEEMIRLWLPRLDKHFFVEREVWGVHCSGMRMRIDAVIRPRDTSEWKNKEVAFGIEFKSDKKSSGAPLGSDGARWLAQCQDYAHCKFDGYGNLYVLLAGGFTPQVKTKLIDNNSIQRLAYHLGVGELKRDPKDGFMILLAGEHKIWTEATGVYLGKTYGLERKWGSR